MLAATKLFFRGPAVPVVFDAAGSYGSGGNGTTGSWSHTVGAAANAVYVLINTAGGASQTATCKVGAISMTLLSSNFYSSGAQGYLFAFALYAPPTGAQTIQFTLTAGAVVAAGSASFRNVGGNGTVTTTSAASGTALSQSAAANGGGTVLQAFAVGAGASTITAYNQTQVAYVPGVAAQHDPIIVGYGSGTFTATSGSSQPWGASAIPVNTF